MMSDRLRQRLEQLNRDPRPATRPHEASPRSRRLAIHVDDPPGDLPRDTTPFGGEEVTTVWGNHWILRQPIAAVWPASQRYLSPWPAMTGDTTVSPSADSVRGWENDLAALRCCFPQRAIYLDLETCGFAGSTIFLIGLLHWHHDQLVLSQLWARHYAEEKAILQTLWSLMIDNDLLITFNGKSFDWPQVHDRSTLHHLGYRQSAEQIPAAAGRQHDASIAHAGGGLTPSDARPEPWHFDLLHHARRRWRNQLPNCRLQTLERYICGRHRVGDLPGSEIPQAYHEYVRRGNPRAVYAILQHNALDLITLLQLALLFLQD